MKPLRQVLATVAIMAQATLAAADGLVFTTCHGGNGGTDFSDAALVSAAETVQAIHIRAGERVDGVGIDFATADGKVNNVFHGGGGGDPSSLTLESDEHVTTIESHVVWKWRADFSRLSIGYIKFTTNKNRIMSGGTPRDDNNGIVVVNAPEGCQLAGFYGSSGKELDAVGGIWTSINAPVAPVGTVAAAPVV